MSSFFFLIWKRGGERGGCIIHHVSYQEGYKQMSAGVFLVQVVSQSVDRVNGE